MIPNPKVPYLRYDYDDACQHIMLKNPENGNLHADKFHVLLNSKTPRT